MPASTPLKCVLLAAGLFGLSACITPAPSRTASEKLDVNNQLRPAAYLSHGHKPVCGYTEENEECLVDVTTKRGYLQYDNADDRGHQEALVWQSRELIRDDKRERKKRD